MYYIQYDRHRDGKLYDCPVIPLFKKALLVMRVNVKLDADAAVLHVRPLLFVERQLAF